MTISPYKFLDSYTKEDRDIFFGREKETEELYSRVFESRILLIYGTSGTGKSSLINCGLANKFNEADWLPVTVRRGTDINRSLAESLERQRIGAEGSDLSAVASAKAELRAQGSGQNSGQLAVGKAERKVDIVKLIRDVYLDHFRPVYLIFDQFEELFIFGSSEEKGELITGVKRVLDSDLQCRFIFSVREEYLAGVTEFERVIPTFLSNRMRIEKMTRANARQVIEGPCRINNIKLEDGFAAALLEKLNPESPEVELTWLQVYLDRIFRTASGEKAEVNYLTLEMLEQAGEVKDLLGTFLEEQISQLDDPESGLVILKSFVSDRGTRQQITGEDVTEYSKTLGREIDSDRVKDMIRRFINLRILREKDENGKYELRHDSLAAKIYEKITLVEKELLEIRQFLGHAYNTYEKRELLLSADELNYIAPYEDKLFLNERILKFISLSRQSLQRARLRRQRIFAGTAIILIIILSFFSVWALMERSNAKEERDSAEREKFAANAASLSEKKAREDAESARNAAVFAQGEAEAAKNVALIERRNAEEQQKRAEEQQKRAEEASGKAIQQAGIATVEKENAEKARQKAEAAEAEATRLQYISLAQNLALKSANLEKNPELMGLLAVQAFAFNKNNDGRREDPIIYDALSKAYLTIDRSRHSILSGFPGEARVIAERNDGSLVSADFDGNIRVLTSKDAQSVVTSLRYRSPIYYIGSDNASGRIITQHDDRSLFLWNKETEPVENYKSHELKGHTDFIRTVAFSDDKTLLATAGRDSSLIIWKIIGDSVTKKGPVITRSGVRSMLFSSKDTMILALEDGRIDLLDLNNLLPKTIYNSGKDKPVTLACNSKKKVLVAGCSNGTLLVFNTANGEISQPIHFPVHSAGIDLITFNSDYSMMATSGWDKSIRFYYFREYFGERNLIGGIQKIESSDSRVRAMIFTHDNRLVAALSDRSIRIWETSSEKLASMICNLLSREMTRDEWNEMVGEDIAFELSCRRSQ